ADRGDFRRRIDHIGDDVVVHVAGLAGENLGDRDALVLGLVGQHRPRDHVPDGVDAGRVGGEMLIHDNAPAIVLLDPHGLEPETVRIGHAADGDQHDIGLDRLRGAAGGRLDLRLEPRTRAIDARHLGGEMKRDALLLERRWNCRHTSASMPGNTRSRNSTTSTSEPSRRQTEPSSSPITPAPTIKSRCGTLSSTRAPVDDTMRFSSMVTPRSLATSEPVAMTIALVSSICVLPSAPLTSTMPVPAICPKPWKLSILFFLNRYATPLTLPSTPSSLNFIMA